MRPVGDYVLVRAFSFWVSFDYLKLSAVWQEGHMSNNIPIQFIPKMSVSEQVEEENHVSVG